MLERTDRQLGTTARPSSFRVSLRSHRVIRRKGSAHAYLTKDDIKANGRVLVAILRDAGQEVPPELAELTSRAAGKGGKGGRGRGRGRGFGRGRGRGGGFGKGQKRKW